MTYIVRWVDKKTGFLMESDYIKHYSEAENLVNTLKRQGHQYVRRHVTHTKLSTRAVK